MFDPEAVQPVVRQQGAICADCGAAMPAGPRRRKLCRPSCRAQYSTAQRERRLLGLAEDLVTLLKRPRRGARRG